MNFAYITLKLYPRLDSPRLAPPQLRLQLRRLHLLQYMYESWESTYMYIYSMDGWLAAVLVTTYLHRWLKLHLRLPHRQHRSLPRTRKAHHRVPPALVRCAVWKCRPVAPAPCNEIGCL